eukprot:scaffold5273_cov158-Skeletonema_menzelii.AAC.19
MWHRRCSSYSPALAAVALLLLFLPSEALTLHRNSRNIHWSIGNGFTVHGYSKQSSPRQGATFLCASSKNDGSDNVFKSSELLMRIEHDTTDARKEQMTTNRNDNNEQGGVQRRQFLIASAALLQLSLITSTAPANAKEPKLTERTNFQQSPINKRFGVTLSEPERIYNLSFITYLSRFLLVFDKECQQWWYTQAQAIPPNSSKEEVDRIRLEQFGKFSASVEVGLMDYEGGDGGDGVKSLLNALVKRYGPSSLTSVRRDENGYIDDNANQLPEVRKAKEALRQIALLFSLLKDYQPVESITQILAADDDAKIDAICMLDPGTGYLPPSFGIPTVSFPEPPTLGAKLFPGSLAKGEARMVETGRILKLELVDGGSGYVETPDVQISAPPGDGTNRKIQATAKAILGKGKNKGVIEKIQIVNPGLGYNAIDEVTVTITPPDKGWTAASAKAILEYQVAQIDVVNEGRGYAAEKPVNVIIDPPPGADAAGDIARSAFAVAYPKGKMTSYASFMTSNVVKASSSSVDTSAWIAGPTSSQLLTLLPSGFGLQFDDKLERYILTTPSSSNNWEDIITGRLEGRNFKPINPIFGFRGRSPIELEKSLDFSTVLRFVASGALCSSGAHFILTPIDVVKTKVQTKPEIYNQGIVGTFKKVWKEEGPATLFDGWEPTFLGFFFAGGTAFFLTEYFRRTYTALATTLIMTSQSASEITATSIASNYEIPLIIASAATSGFLCCFIIAPFEAIRVRTVAQPDYADDIFGVASRMIQEEGFPSLFSAVPVWFLKEMKFLVFDTSTEYLLQAYPVAREDIRLSLLISLIGGTLGGIAATIVSNPADVVVTEMKKAKSDMSMLEAVDILLQRAGPAAFAKGMQLRMVFYSLLVSLQFLLYDAIRIALGVGSDDMKLYLNVLGAALSETSAT